GVGPGDRGHGERRQDQTRRAGHRSRQDRVAEGRCRRGCLRRRMAGVVWSFLGVLAGAFLALQAPANAELSRGLGLPIAAAAISFLAGAIVLAGISTVIVKAGAVTLDWRAPAPWLFIAGGCLGGAYVTIATM